MIVVSNTSPLMNLAAIGKVDILSSLYATVTIPEAVLQELLAAGVPGFAAHPVPHPAWIQVATVGNQLLAASLRLELHAGESEAVALAAELSADIILLDERRARRVARQMGLSYVGLLGVLLEAKAQHIIRDVRPILDDLITEAGFWVAADLREYVLAQAGE